MRVCFILLFLLIREMVPFHGLREIACAGEKPAAAVGFDITGMRVVNVDFLFDGGSLVFSLLDDSGKEATLLVRASESIKNSPPRLELTWSSGTKKKEFAVDDAQADAIISTLGKSMSKGEPANSLHVSTVAFLATLRCKLTVLKWGWDAVSTLRDGNWHLCFCK